MTDGTGPMKILAPLCPGCNEPPELALDRQYWCGSDSCRVICWDPTDDPARFKARAQQVDLSVLDPGARTSDTVRDLPAMTRSDHLVWAKERALAYLPDWHKIGRAHV